MSKKLRKSGKNKIIAGVCGGVGEYFKIDPTIVRLIFAIIALAKGAGLILYVIAAIVMPAGEDSFDDENIENLKSANMDSSESEKADKKPNNNADSTHSDEEFDSFFEK